MAILSRHLARLDEPGRLGALLSAELLDSPAETAFDRLTHLATRLVHAPVALVSLIDDHRQFFKSSCGLPDSMAGIRDLPLSHSFCKHVVENGEPLVVPDTRLHPIVYDNPAIHDMNVIAYLGIPIRLDKYVLGSFCVIDHVPRQWSSDDIAAMTELTDAVIAEIELRLALRVLEEDKLELEQRHRARDEAESTVEKLMKQAGNFKRQP